MPIIATCGHEIKNFKGKMVWVALTDREFNHAIDYMTLCNKCKKMYDKNGILLKTSKQKKDWLENKD